MAVGDDFHVTKWMFADLPFGFGRLSKDERKQLLALAPELKSAADEAVQYKLNAGPLCQHSLRHLPFRN